jgi:cell envelope opacity-associated protein A
VVRRQCWSGKEQFTFKNGDWSYGKKEWAESRGAWKVSSGDAPELVSCESVPSFSAKANAIATKTATQTSKIQKADNADKGATSQPAPVTPSPAKIKTAESDTAAVAQKPVTPAASAECKKYFASVGQMISVPCTE